MVDDCSTDKTAKVIKEYMERDSRIKYRRLENNSGAAVARNRAVDLAGGKYLAFLDSDDIWFQKNSANRFVSWVKTITGLRVPAIQK